MRNRDQYDISSTSYEAFVTFLFDHEIVPISDKPAEERGPWYWHADVTFDANRVADFYTTLFTEPRQPLSNFDDDELEQGFWAIQSGNLECAVSNVIWMLEVSFEKRASCVLCD